ncbi:MAG TPA: adenylate/guanylate cyclase domain-containing protein, partial [Alicycliphilus sp.]|nr:adenylate/guanylate cyclase domain-containing protein [Alicycliphilus sp.]
LDEKRWRVQLFGSDEAPISLFKADAQADLAERYQRKDVRPLDFGMGLHAGRVAVGRVGYEDTTSFTAVGEVVNTASRLQDYSKVAAARLVISLDAARLAGVADGLGDPVPVQVRGRSQPLQVLHVRRPSELWGG